VAWLKPLEFSEISLIRMQLDDFRYSGKTDRTYRGAHACTHIHAVVYQPLFRLASWAPLTLWPDNVMDGVLDL